MWNTLGLFSIPLFSTFLDVEFVATFLEIWFVTEMGFDFEFDFDTESEPKIDDKHSVPVNSEEKEKLLKALGGKQVARLTRKFWRKALKEWEAKNGPVTASAS